MLRIYILLFTVWFSFEAYALNALYRNDQHVMQFFPEGYFVYSVRNLPVAENISGDYVVFEDTVFCFQNTGQGEKILFFRGVINRRLLYTQYMYYNVLSPSYAQQFYLEKTYYPDKTIKTEMINKQYDETGNLIAYDILSWTKDKKPVQWQAYQHNEKHGPTLVYDTTKFDAYIDTILYYEEGQLIAEKTGKN